jgi:hypothetical protein
MISSLPHVTRQVAGHREPNGCRCFEHRLICGDAAPLAEDVCATDETDNDPAAAPAPLSPGYAAQYRYQPAPVPTQSNGHAVASMVLGILFIMFCWLFGIVGLTMAILAIVLAGRAPLDQFGRWPGMAKTGRTTGIIGCTLSSFHLLAYVLAFNGRS